MPRWRFTLRYEPGSVPHWTWGQLADDGAIMQESSEAFESIGDCVKDAKRYGYVGLLDDDDDSVSDILHHPSD